MPQERFTIVNPNGDRLAARLDSPGGSEPHAYALFAHCFTCGKNIRAATRVATALTDAGFAVLRFDFTGLGNSELFFGNAPVETPTILTIVGVDDLLGEPRFEAALDQLGMDRFTANLERGN